MKLNFSNVDTTANNSQYDLKLPEGIHSVVVDEVTTPKENKSGNQGFCMWLRKEGYKSVNRYIQFSTDNRDLAKIMNTMAAFGIELEKRDYEASEIYKIFKSFKGKKCQVVVYHRETTWTNPAGEVKPATNVEVKELRPLVDEVVEEVVESDDTPW